MRIRDVFVIALLLSSMPVVVDAAEMEDSLPGQFERLYEPLSTVGYSLYGVMTASTRSVSFEMYPVAATIEYAGVLAEDTQEEISGALAYDIVNVEEFNSGNDFGCRYEIKWIAFKQTGETIRVSLLGSDTFPIDGPEIATICTWMSYRHIEQ